jgi:aryl-phospho-beta-D-glucosidase BglC (GH1 family)
MATLRLSPRRSLWKPLVGIIALLAAAASVPPMIGMHLTAAPLALHVSGNQLVNASGQTVVLRGADMAGQGAYCAENWTADPFGGMAEDNAQTFAAMKSWGINSVRLALNEDCWLGINGVEIGGAAYQAPIEKLVRDLEANGFYVILNLEGTAPGSQRAVDQEPMADQDHSPAFWSSVAAAFASDTGVLYDLFNEPYFYWIAPGQPSQWQCLWQGCVLTQYVNGLQGQPYTVAANWTAAGFDQLTQDVRAAGAEQPILAGCVNWAQDCSQWASSFAEWGSGDANTVVSWHPYPGGSCDTASCWASTMAPLAAQYPVVVGETGDSVAAPATFLPTFLPWTAANGVSVLAFTWDAWANADDVLVTNMQTGAPTPGEGVTYKNWLAGLGLASASPSASGTSTPTASGTASAMATRGPTATPTSGLVGGVNVEPSMRPWRYVGANPQSWWCVQPLCTSDFSNPVATATEELQEAKSLGAAWVRLEIPWPVIETSRGVFDWSRADALFAAARSVGEPILPVLMWTPQWAGGGSALNQPPTNISDWTTFVTDFTQRYGSQVPAVDVWNEPDSGNYFVGSAATYVSDLLNPAYSTIKAVDPSLPVIEAGSANDAGGGTAFLSAVLAAGGKFDIASFHNYAGTYGSEAQAYRSALNAGGRSSTPIWMTEFGVQSASGNQSATIQSVFGSGGIADLAAAAWYNLRDTGAWTCTATSCTEVSPATWGLLQANFAPKPSYLTMQSLLGGSGSTGSPPSPSPSATPSSSPSPSLSPSATASPRPSPSPTSSPGSTPHATPTPAPAGDPPTPTPDASPDPTTLPSPSPIALPYTDGFSQDALGSIPAGWTVSGVNAGFAVEQTDGPQPRVYAHTGWTATTVGGSTLWSNYTLSLNVRLSAWSSESDSVDVRYVNGDNHYAVRFLGGNVIDLVRVDGGVTTELARVSLAYTAGWHQLQVTAQGASLSVGLDGATILTAQDDAISCGGIGMASNDPFAIADVSVTQP